MNAPAPVPSSPAANVAPAILIARSGFYRFVSDPGHGWLRVPLDRVIALGIADRITPYSYIDQADGFAWLEEDCDLSTFIDALELAEGVAAWWKAHVKEVSTDHDAFIRGLPSFRSVELPA